MIEIENQRYEIIKDYREAFEQEKFEERYTDYFSDFDYILGDWAYGKLRLKGFYDEANKKANKINNIKNVDAYIEENCAYGCRHFILKKVK